MTWKLGFTELPIAGGTQLIFQITSLDGEHVGRSFYSPLRLAVKVSGTGASISFSLDLFYIDFRMTSPNVNVDARYGQFNAVAGDQYIIQQCISQTSVPHLSDAFLSFKFIVGSIDEIQSSKQQLNVLECAIATLLRTLDTAYCDGKLSRAVTAGPLADLQQ